MNRFLLLTINILFSNWLICSAQKPAIDTTAVFKWPQLLDFAFAISNDGNFAGYTIANQPQNSQTIVLLSTRSAWKREFLNASFLGIPFTANNRIAIVKFRGDSLGIIKLGTNEIKYIPQVKSIGYINKGVSNWLIYTQSNKLIVLDLRTNKEQVFPELIQYRIMSNKGDILLIESRVGQSLPNKLQYINLTETTKTTIWEGTGSGNFSYNEKTKEIAFTTQGDRTDKEISIWYYKPSMEKATLLMSDKTANLRREYNLTNSRLSFNRDGDKLFLDVKMDMDTIAYYKKQQGVNIWNYKDIRLQSQQMAGNDNDNEARAVIDIETKHLTLLSKPNEQVTRIGVESIGNNLWCYEPWLPDAYFNKADRPSFYIASTADGSRTEIAAKTYVGFRETSPGERFILWYDLDSLAWFSWDIAAKKKYNLSKGIPVSLNDVDAVKSGRYDFFSFGFAGWSSDGRYALLYDQYDIWKVDLANKEVPVNITGQIGRKQKISFSIVPLAGKDIPLDLNKELLLAGFNTHTKENGFWRLKGSSLQLCNMDGHTYYIGRYRTGRTGFVEYNGGTIPVKSLNSNIYLVQRMSAEESPNLFLTKDFKTYKQVSFIHPERQYNWLTSELVSWQMSDAKWSQGILYKPENFDPTKKYPVIFTYYEKRSDELNGFLKPKLSQDRINIPTYVSNDYLVFVPDIYYNSGHNGEGVVNSVVSAAKYLSKFPWVDSTKMGLQGHSFGGWETNYLITHSNIFAAACEAAGVSDQTSGYGQLTNGVGLRQEFYETGSQGSSYGIGRTPWTDPQAYVRNSPIFNIGNVSTPLLMMHCEKDGAVPFAQAIEMFTGLKRAGKKVWLLQYDNGVHFVSGKDAVDYTIRMRQFFDHYLKGAPAPVWMTKGIPFSKKGVDKGLEPDTSGEQP